MSQSVRRPVSQVEDFKARFGVVQGQRGMDPRLPEFTNPPQGSGFSSRQMIAAIALAMVAGMSGAGVFWFAQDFGAKNRPAPQAVAQNNTQNSAQTAASPQPAPVGEQSSQEPAEVIPPASPQASSLSKSDNADSPVLNSSEYGVSEPSVEPPAQKVIEAAAPAPVPQQEAISPVVAQPPAPVVEQQSETAEATAVQPMQQPEAATSAIAPAPPPAVQGTAPEPQTQAIAETQSASEPTSEPAPEAVAPAPAEQDVALATQPEPEAFPEPTVETPQPEQQAVLPSQTSPPAIVAGQVWRDCSTCPELVAIVVPKSASADGVNLKFPDGDAQGLVPFAIGRIEVTFDDWSQCVAAGACREVPSDAGWGAGTRPVINVSHQMIVEQYLPWLSKTSGKEFRLPTSNEWDVAEAGGEVTANQSIPQLTAQQLCRSANYAAPGAGVACEDPFPQTAPAGSFEANSAGLFDMRGNVWEWVSDCWTPGFNYKTKPSERDCRKRLVRGGSWSSQQTLSALAPKGFEDQTRASRSVGFRVARNLP
jgi:hypothetical protein